jgi:sulfide:quinone oxidoreductase
VLDAIRVVLVLPTPAMFGVKVFADELERVAARYDIEVRKNSEVSAVDADARSVTITDNAEQTTEELAYDMLHVVPRQSAPDWIKASPISDPDNPGGYVQIDKNTMRHSRFDNIFIFALGDAGSSPNSKTGAAIRKQAPIVAANLRASLAGRPLPARYGGYASCPLTTARGKMLLAEFDYTMHPTPSIPLIDTHERRDMWYLKRRGLPALYWNLILTGRA